MMTFLPFPDFQLSAKSLDSRRLNKQLVECQQILNSCLGKSKGWITHPCIKMWKSYEYTLVQYAHAIYHEYWKRFNKQHKSWEEINKLDVYPYPKPEWLGDERLHKSHRSRLWQKDPEYYKDWKEDGILLLEAWWPVR